MCIRDSSKPDMPTHKSIIAFDMSSKKTLWQNDNYVFALVNDDKVYCYQQRFENRVYFALDCFTGNVVEELGNDVSILNQLKEKLDKEFWKQNYLFPEYFNRNENGEELHHKYLKQVLSDNVVKGEISYLKIDNLLLFNYHEVAKNNTYSNIFTAVDLAKNKILLEETLDKNLVNLMPESFFVKDNFLFLICLLYTSDAADERSSVDLGGRRIIKKKTKLNILDVGCGNGWLIGQLAKEFDHNYFGIDTNLVELEQADKLFSSEKVIFIYGDISKATLPTDTFNIVILNSTLQYFKDVDVLLKELLTISKSYGEVHILDTPFYLANDLIRVKNNSLKHFSSIGLPEMTQKFFHHTTDELKYFRNQLLYNPNSVSYTHLRAHETVLDLVCRLLLEKKNKKLKKTEKKKKTTVDIAQNTK